MMRVFTVMWNKALYGKENAIQRWKEKVRKDELRKVAVFNVVELWENC